MPTYDYRCATCGIAHELNVPIAERDKPTEIPCDCGGVVERVWGAPLFAYDHLNVTTKQTPEGFKDILKNIKKHHRGSTIQV